MSRYVADVGLEEFGEEALLRGISSFLGLYNDNDTVIVRAGAMY